VLERLVEDLQFKHLFPTQYGWLSRKMVVTVFSALNYSLENSGSDHDFFKKIQFKLTETLKKRIENDNDLFAKYERFKDQCNKLGIYVVQKKHRRDSSAPIVDLGFDDPEVLYQFEKLKVKDLQFELEKKVNEVDLIKQEANQKEKRVRDLEDAHNDQQQTIDALKEELDRMQKSKLEMIQSSAQELTRMKNEAKELQNQLNTKQENDKNEDTENQGGALKYFRFGW